MMMIIYYQYSINNKPVKLKKMKNFEATRGKIKMYLNALKERYSTVEWREYHANKICKEFQVSVLLPQLLKNEGYYHYEHKGVPSMMLSEKIVMLSEVSAHNKIREFCKESNERKSVRNLQNKEKDKLNKKRLDAKAVNKAKKEVYLQNQFNFTNRGFGQEGYKTLSIKVGRNFYKNTILIDCEKNDLTVTEWITKKLVAGEVIESQEPPKEQTIGEIKQSLHNNPQFKDSFKKPEPAKRGRPFMIEQRGNSNSGMSNQEVFKMIDRYHAPDKVIQQTEVKVDAAETKIKSLETIMNLFLKGIINTQELESLKKGILNK